MKTFETISELGAYCADRSPEVNVLVHVMARGAEVEPQNFDFTVTGSEEFQCLLEMHDVMVEFDYTDFAFLVLESNFRAVVSQAVDDMIEAGSIVCATVSVAEADCNMITVHFLEEDGSDKMHGVMAELHKRISTVLGYPVCIGHNNPTDGNVLLIAGSSNAKVYYSDECCKRSTIESYANFKATGRKGYGSQLRSIFFAAETISDGLDKTPEYVLETLDWNKDPQAQLIQLLIDYHN